MLLEAELGSSGDRGAQVRGRRDLDQPQEQTGNHDKDDDNDPEMNPKMIGLFMIFVKSHLFPRFILSISPSVIPSQINPNAIGLFMTESSDAAKRAWFFCR